MPSVNTANKIHLPALRAIIICLLVMVCSIARAAPLNEIRDNQAFPASVEFQYYEDSQNFYHFDTLQEIPEDAWRDSATAQASFGFTSSVYWVRTEVANEGKSLKNLVFEVDYVLLDEVAFKSQKSDGSVSELTTGDRQHFYPRHIDHPSILFRFELKPDERIVIYTRARTEGSMILPFKIWQEKQFFEAAAAQQKVHFFYYGVLSIIIIINLAVFISLRERLYLYYAAAILGYLVFFVSSKGFVHQIFLPYAPDVNNRVFLISMPFLALFSLLFSRDFLKTATYSPKLDFALRASIVYAYFSLMFAMFFDYDLAIRVGAVGAILLFGVLFFAGPITWYKRRRAGIFFTVAWVPLAVGLAATTGRLSGALPNNFWTEYAMQIGSGMEALILTLALADRLFREREKKIRAQGESLQIEKQRNATQSLLAQAMSRDPVTQLSNRNCFEWLMRTTLIDNPSKRYFVAVARITRIDDITRTLGLSSSERVIRLIAQQINNESASLAGVVTQTNGQGSIEAAYQLSGETFGLLIDQSEFEKNPDEFYSLLNKLVQPMEVEGLSLDLAPRFGSALYPKHGREPAQLIRNALIAIDSAHRSRGMMGIYNQKFDIYSESRLTLLTELREAIESGVLTMHYQPKIDVGTNDVVGIEALARWIHPERGFIPPDEFIPLAEEAGIINRLTLWAFEYGMRDLKSLRDDGYTGSMSVNISPRDLLSKNLGQHLHKILASYEIPADVVLLELTETAAMDDPVAGSAALTRLADLGLKISIDDFGTGYSSLSYLQRLPATEIKLDRSLIHDICATESSRVIVKASIDMVHALGYELVAEGVEDEQTANTLRDLNCDRFQGYWCCRPLPLLELKEWFLKRREAS